MPDDRHAARLSDAGSAGVGRGVTTSAWIHVTQAKARCIVGAPGDRGLVGVQIVFRLEDLFLGSFLGFSATPGLQSPGHLGAGPAARTAVLHHRVPGLARLPPRAAGATLDSERSNTCGDNVGQRIIGVKAVPGRATPRSEPPPPEVRRLLVDEASEGQRLDNYLIKQLKGVPKTHVYRVIRSGEVRVNKGRAAVDTRLAIGDEVRVPPVRMAAADGVQVYRDVNATVGNTFFYHVRVVLTP